MANPDFKLILCDLGNVLINFDHRIAVRRILKFTDAKFDEVYQLFFDSTFTKDFEEGKISPEDFFKLILGKLQLRDLDFDQFASIWNEIFSDNTGLLNVLKVLKKNYPLHLISNINELHYRYIQKKFPAHLKVFDGIYLSYEVGRRKPDREIYRRAVEGAGFRFQDTLYTDDRLDLIEAAKGMGIISVLFKDVDDFKKQLQKLGVNP